uniref:LAGLIDADG homing endonuclease n=1 Tax=Ditylenchus dipsaci TaxID=166011 RepID=A0A915D0I7_9BILA
MDPRNLKWADDTPAFPINYWLPLLLSKHLRICSTTIYMALQSTLQTKQLNWKKNISVAANSIENLLNNNRLISCQNLVLGFKLEFPFRPYDSFFAIKVVEWTEDIKQNYGVITSIVEHKSSNTVFIVSKLLEPDTLLEYLKQSFVQSTTAKPFRLLLNCYNGHKTRDRRFYQTNPRTKELLELREVSKDERNLIVSGGMYEKYFCRLERKPI